MYIWKRVRTRYAMLRMPGLDHNKAFMFACTRKGYWRIANSHIFTTTITNARLKQAGYTFSQTTTKLLRRKLRNRRLWVCMSGGVGGRSLN